MLPDMMSENEGALSPSAIFTKSYLTTFRRVFFSIGFVSKANSERRWGQIQNKVNLYVIWRRINRRDFQEDNMVSSNIAVKH